MFGISAFSEAPFSALAGGDSANVNVILTGQAGTGAVGTTAFVCVAHINPTGQVGTSALGTATVAAGASVTLSGQAGTSALGSPTISASALVNDYGNNPDEPLSALTASVSGLGVNGSVVSIVPGVSGGVGSVSVTTNADSNVTVVGQTSTLTLGTPSTAGAANVLASTDTEAVGAANSAVGSITASGKANISVDGQTSTSALGTLSSITGKANISASGLTLQATLNNPSTRTENAVSISGVSSTSSLGSISSIGKANITPVGQVGTTGEPKVLIWNMVDDSQTPNYSDVSSSQTPNYGNVNDTQTPNWEEVA